MRSSRRRSPQLGSRDQRQAEPAVQVTDLELGCEHRVALLGSAVPERLGRHTWTVRRDGDPGRVSGRERRPVDGPVDPVHHDDDEPAGRAARAAVPRPARADLSGHHAAVERQGDALDAGHRPELPLLLFVLEAGPVHRLQRLREGCGKGTSTSPASTARSTSRASWKAAPPREAAPQARS